MKFREYLSLLSQMVEDHPEVLDLETVYAVDDEGNAHHSVEFAPDLGFFNEEDNVFYDQKDFEYVYQDEEDMVYSPNAIRIN